MKPVILFLLLFSFSYSSRPQSVIGNPRYGFSIPEYLQLTKVELGTDFIVLSVHIKIPENSCVGIHEKSFIQTRGDTTQYSLVKAVGIDVAQKYHWKKDEQEEISCSLYFPKPNELVDKIDFGEPGASGFRIFDIHLLEEPLSSFVPNELAGNWFATKTGNWTFSFLDSIVIFESQIWNYDACIKTNDGYEITVCKEEVKKTIVCEAARKDNYFLYFKGEPHKHFSKHSKVYLKSLNVKEIANGGGKKSKTLYKGLIRNYRAEIGAFIALNYRNNRNEEFAKVADIEAGGRFTFELEIDEPQKINVMFPTGSGSIYLLPGANLFQLFNSGSSEMSSLFMGESSAISFRQNLIAKFSRETIFSNNLAEMTEGEQKEFLATASYDDLLKLKTRHTKNMTTKDKLFLVPSRGFKLKRDTEKGVRSVNVGISSFWISNEITNEEYRKFANHIISNPDHILRWEDTRYNPSTASYENHTKIQIYSEVAKSLIDSGLNVCVFCKNRLQEINIIDYLNDENYNDFPAVGIPLEGAKYYCRWLNQKSGLIERSAYRLPNELEYRALADYLPEVKNKNNFQRTKDILSEVPEDTIAYLNTNAKEWIQVQNIALKGYSNATQTPEKYVVLESLDNLGQSLEENYTNTYVTAGFRVVRRLNDFKSNASFLGLMVIVLLSIIVCMLVAFVWWKWRIRQRFRKEAQNRKLRELELTAIRSQMNPHFLFNSLNSVQNLVQQNKGREAHLYLSDFAGLIRKVLNNSEKEEVSLAEELEMIQQYLNLEKLRFDIEFEVSVNHAIDAHNTLVPSMLLQPFVENAIVHGLQNKQGAKQLVIRVDTHEVGIVIRIEDNGVGRKAAGKIAKHSNGKGTRLVQERLEILGKRQGEKYELQMFDLDEGTGVEIVVPEE